jgi:hypothetical protein
MTEKSKNVNTVTDVSNCDPKLLTIHTFSNLPHNTNTCGSTQTYSYLLQIMRNLKTITTKRLNIWNLFCREHYITMSNLQMHPPGKDKL